MRINYSNELRLLRKNFVNQYKRTHKAYKSISDYLYTNDNGIFIEKALILSYNRKQDDFSITSITEAKPYFFDDLFWEIFGMSSNKNEPMSLRCIGAFTCPREKICWIEEKRQSIEELSKAIDEIFKKNDALTNEFTLRIKKNYKAYEERFLDYPEDESHGTLLKVLANIYIKDYRNALDILSRHTKTNGGFVNGNKSIFECCWDYCSKKLLYTTPTI